MKNFNYNNQIVETRVELLEEIRPSSGGISRTKRISDSEYIDMTTGKIKAYKQTQTRPDELTKVKSTMAVFRRRLLLKTTIVSKRLSFFNICSK